MSEIWIIIVSWILSIGYGVFVVWFICKILNFIDKVLKFIETQEMKDG